MKAKVVKRHDPLTPQQRSAQMAKVRAKKNRSTEMRVAAYLIGSGFSGWKRHPKEVTGCPDFCFIRQRVAIFVDGCFWHGCPKCRRNLPFSRRGFWRRKITSNRQRDRRVVRSLRRQGFIVLRIWEHDLSNGKWIDVLRGALQGLRKRNSYNLR